MREKDFLVSESIIYRLHFPAVDVEILFWCPKSLESEIIHVGSPSWVGDVREQVKFRGLKNWGDARHHVIPVSPPVTISGGIWMREWKSRGQSLVIQLWRGRNCYLPLKVMTWETSIFPVKTSTNKCDERVEMGSCISLSESCLTKQSSGGNKRPLWSWNWTPMYMMSCTSTMSDLVRWIRKLTYVMRWIRKILFW